MQIDHQWVATATALIAIWYTIRESRRNNSVVLKIKHCGATGSQAIDENNGRGFHEFKLIIQNRGISLHHLHASISFRSPDNHGLLRLPLKRQQRRGDRDEFAKGMIAEFGFKSYELDKHDLAFLEMLRDPKRQEAQLRIFSQDYLAASFRVGGIWDQLKSRWNDWAFQFNDLFTRRAGKNKEGHDVMRMYEILPKFPVLAKNILDFARWTEEESPDDKRKAS